MRRQTLSLLGELAGILAPFELDLIGQARAEGPVNVTYNNVISRSDAAATIPEDVTDALLGEVDEMSIARESFTSIPVAQSQTRIPVISALPTAYWVNGDTGLKQTTELNWANKYLNIEELAAIVPIPENVLDDQSFDVWGEIRPRLAEAIARAFDSAVFFGTNAPGTFPTAVATAAIAAGNVVSRGTNNAAAGGIVGDFSDLYGTVEADGFDPDTVVGNRVLKAAIRNSRSTTGDSLDDDFRQEVKAALKFPMRGLWTTPATAGAVQALAYQRDQFVVGIRKDVTYKLLDQAVITDGSGAIIYNLPQQDMVAMRVTFRAGWQVANVINQDQPVEANRYPGGVLRTAP